MVTGLWNACEYGHIGETLKGESSSCADEFSHVNAAAAKVKTRHEHSSLADQDAKVVKAKPQIGKQYWRQNRRCESESEGKIADVKAAVVRVPRLMQKQQ